MDEVGFDFGNGEANYFLQIVDELLIGEARQITKRLLIAIFEHHGLAEGVALDPVFCARLLNEECLIHHRIPLNVGIDLHVETMHDGRGAHGIFHLRFFRGHAKALVEMSMKDFDALVLERADYLFAVLPLVDLARIQTLAAAADHKEIRLVRAARVDESVLDPCSLRAGAIPVGLHIAAECSPSSELSKSDAAGHGSHEISAVHSTPVLECAVEKSSIAESGEFSHTAACFMGVHEI